MVIKEIGNRNLVKPIIAENRHNPYSNLKFFKDAGKLNNYYYALFLRKKENKIFQAFVRGGTQGFLIFSDSSWDSEVFGMKMAKIEYFAARGDYSAQLGIKVSLLIKALEYAKARGIKHLSARIDSDDFSSVHAFEGCGFKLMDNLATYLLRERKIIFPQVQRWFRVGEITKGDLECAGNLLADKIVLGHYSVDQAIPLLKAREMYKKWLETKFKDLKNNDIFVARRGKEVVGCSVFSFNSLLKKYTGLKSLHRGLVAVKPKAAGCFYAFLNANLKKRRGFDFAEFETQTYNYNMTGLLQKLGMQLIRCRYTLHKSL